jgi:aspartyl-tRNA(Asn)/glutamyl-tRNA(Gln) amidotransferase subunit A
MTELADFSATELARGYERRELQPLEVWASVRARMEAWEPIIQATCWRADDAAESAARASDRRWQAGRPRGPLDGVPVTLKENIATRGVPTSLGTAAAELVTAAQDAPAAARLREAGAVIVAKTTMPDYGMLSSGVSSLHPTTRNPWNPDWTPGGSSAGAAAAAAAGYGPIHIGTDIGGSIRLPAGWTGVLGFKPSFGRVPIVPPYYGRVAGPLTRTVADAARAMAIISRPDDRDHLSLPPEDVPWDKLHAPRSPIRIGLAVEAGAGMPVEAEVAATAASAATALEHLGVAVEAVGPLITDEMLDGLDRFWRMRSYRDWLAVCPQGRERLLPYLREWISPAAGYTGAEVFHGFSQMDAIAKAAGAAIGKLDFLVSPVAPVPAFAAELPSPHGDPARALEHIAFTVPFSMSGHPAISIPWTTGPGGKPVGVQIVGRRFADLDVLRLAKACESLRPPLPAWPSL